MRVRWFHYWNQHREKEEKESNAEFGSSPSVEEENGDGESKRATEPVILFLEINGSFLVWTWESSRKEAKWKKVVTLCMCIVRQTERKAYGVAVVSPTAEFHCTRLLIEGKVFNIDFT